MEKIENLYDTVLIDPNEDLVLLDKTLVQHDSNLIKFIYAICCFDYENLPVPLTRIEEFANALITGEIPNIEPQSRSEQFFKAILTGDISTLPDPQSRGEVLLDKLARGNNDLSDIEPIQSRYELLLAYLIKNGGSLPNLTYIFYQFQETAATFQNTKEKPYKSLSIKGQTYQNILPEPTTPVLTNNAEMFSVDEGLDETIEIVDGVAKSAILTGNTLVNLAQTSFGTSGANINFIQTKIENGKTYTIPNQAYGYITIRTNAHKSLKPSTTYTILFEIVENTIQDYNGVTVCGTDDSYFGRNENKLYHNSAFDLSVGKKQLVVTTSKDISTYDGLGLGFPGFPRSGKNDSGIITIKNVMVIEGDHSNEDIHYFEGMKSVKMPVLTTTGKNLFDVSSFVQGKEEKIYYSQNGDKLQINALDQRLGATYFTYKVKKDETLTLSTNPKVPLRIFNVTNQVMINSTTDGTLTYTAETDGEIGFKFIANEYPTLIDVQLEKSSLATSHEPFKSNILTVNEEVELRGIGDVKDELDLLTGELTQRIGEIVLNGGNISFTNLAQYMTDTSTAVLTSSVSNTNPYRSVKCNKLPSYKQTDSIWEASSSVEMGISGVNATYSFCIRLPHSLTGVQTTDDLNTVLSKFKTYLQANPITVQCELATESVKTVDLSVVDQDTNATDLHFFKDGHIIQSSGADTSLIPTLDYQAKTSNSYVMDLMKSNTQYTMKATSASETFTIDGTSYDAVTNGTFTSPSSITNKLLTMSNTTNEEVMIIEGDVTDKTIPYFEGIKSAFEGEDKIEVLSTGKNLVDNAIFGNKDDSGYYSRNNERFAITLKPNTTYICFYKARSEDVINELVWTIRIDNTGEGLVGGKIVSSLDENIEFTFTTNSNANYLLSISPNNGDDTGRYYFKDFILAEQGGTSLYEPYKSNSTKIPLLAPLRSINEEIRDEIDIDLLNKKAVITQRIELDDATNEYIQLENPIVEEVDIVVTDQDGNEIPKPKSYDEVTHFSINSLIPPIVEVEVQTSNQEDLETLSDTIDEIENQQDQLMTTSEEQEDGVQSVMLGLTEVFEESEEL